MSPRNRRTPEEVSRLSREKHDRRQHFLSYLQAHNLPKNEQSAHIYAYTVTSSVTEKVNLVSELLKGMEFDSLLTRQTREE